MLKFKENSHLHFISPVPVWKRVVTDKDLGMPLKDFNDRLVKIATDYYKAWEVEVPDERHIDKSQISSDEFNSLNNRDFFRQETEPAVGKWHAVKTNNFLDLDFPEVKLLKKLILKDYMTALEEYSLVEKSNLSSFLKNCDFVIDESWIQFYKNGDHKVLHNHLRYGDDFNIKNIWAGGYYIDDGSPDIHQPYSGRFEFNVRNSHYIVKPVSGMIMLWPGDVLHMVHPFYGSSVRKCINFNLSTNLVDKKLSKGRVVLLDLYNKIVKKK